MHRATIYFYCESCSEYDENREILIKLTIDEQRIHIDKMVTSGRPTPFIAGVPKKP